MASSDTICLFDVDGTLTLPRQKAAPGMKAFLERLKTMVHVGLVGGSDLKKISEQMGDDVIGSFEYVFSENGLVYHKNGKLHSKQSIVEHMGEEKLQEFINFVLKNLSDIKLPCKRGTFVEFRSGLINICPVGRSCTQAERDAFWVYDKQHHIREKLVAQCREKFEADGLRFVIGGQISFDVFPEGWDKRYCLQFVKKDGIKHIHFFGDKTAKGGNDHDIFMDPRTIGHSVASPEDTMRQLEEMFF